MRSAFAFVAGALLLGTVAVAAAQSVETGTVVRIDPQSRIVVLDDGRMYRVTQNTMLVVDNQPATITTLVPGQRVMIQSGEVVTFRGGQYVAVGPSAVVAQAPPPVVTLICNWPGSTDGPLSAATTLSKCLMPYAGTSTVVAPADEPFAS